MDVKCRVCLASSEAKLYHSLTAVFPVYFKSTRSVLNILQMVTSSTVIISSGWPHKICTACLKSLKESYNFIKDFQKSQQLLKEDMEKQTTVFIKEEDEIVVKIEPPDEDMLDPLQINGDSNDAISCMKTKPILKQKIMNPKVVKEKIKKEDMEKEKVTKGNDIALPLKKKKIDIRISDHNYTKDPNYQIQDFELDSEESMSSEGNINNSNLIETIRIINTSDEKLLTKTEKIVMMSVGDVLDIRRRPKKSYHLNPKSAKPNTKVFATIQAKSDPLKVLTTSRILNRTRRLGNKGETFQCSFCFKAFDTIRGLSLHKYIHTPEYMNKLKCKLCGKQYRSKKGLFIHKQQHLGNLLKCDQCDKVLSSKWQVIEHKRRLHGDGLPERYMCNECGKTFKYHNALKYHIIAIHHKEDKAYLCGFCGFKCATQTYLKRHERCHTNERPYNCKLCSKSFRGTAELYSHNLMHEQKTRHHCKFCGKGFITSWNMKVHWLKHGGNHTCDVCSKSFIDDAVLKFHYMFRHKIRSEEKDAVNVSQDLGIVGEKLFDSCDSPTENDAFLQ